MSKEKHRLGRLVYLYKNNTEQIRSLKCDSSERFLAKYDYLGFQQLRHQNLDVEFILKLFLRAQKDFYDYYFGGKLTMSNLLKHLKTIRKHRKYVRKCCFKMGLYWQGLIHDLSKYSPIELSIAKYYNGKKSPHQQCRDILGYSPCWVHHYHKNKHHWEYWLDTNDLGEFYGIKMPYKYVIESVCDMIGASKAYNPNGWKADMPLIYWNTHNNDGRIMHKTSINLAKYLIERLADMGEVAFFNWYEINEDNLKNNYANDYLYNI